MSISTKAPAYLAKLNMMLRNQETSANITSFRKTSRYYAKTCKIICPNIFAMHNKRQVKIQSQAIPLINLTV